MKDNFFTPKSVFKGKNADGSKFTMEEWDFNSIGNLGGEFTMKLLLASAIMFIASPLSLIIGIFTYNGKVSVANIIGIILGGYFWFDASNQWIVSTFTNVFLTENGMRFIIAVNIASFFTHIFLLIATLVFKKELNEFPMMWILLISLSFIFYKIYSANSDYHYVKDKSDIELRV